jgi:hypothetical protein
VTGLVDARRLAGRTDEKAGKQVRQARVPLPVQDKACQKVRTSEERAVERSCSADHHVIAAAGAGVAPVDHELVGAQPGLTRLIIDPFGDRLALLPAGGGMHIDFDHTGIGCNPDNVEARVMGRAVAFDMNFQPKPVGGNFRGRYQFEIVLDLFDRWHEDAQPTVTRFDGNRRAHCSVEIADGLLDPLLRGLGGGELGARLRRGIGGTRVCQGIIESLAGRIRQIARGSVGSDGLTNG